MLITCGFIAGKHAVTNYITVVEDVIELPIKLYLKGFYLTWESSK